MNFVFVFYIDHLALRVFRIVCFLRYLTCMHLYFQTFFLVGDFTIGVSNQSHPLYSQLFTITSSFSLYQTVKDFTHFNFNGNHSIIDLVFISSPFHLNSCYTIPPLSTSDHKVYLSPFTQMWWSKDHLPTHGEPFGVTLMPTLS